MQHDRAFKPACPLDAWEYFSLSPRHYQRDMHLSEARFRVDVWHRRAGKTLSKAVYLLERAASCPLPRGRYAYLAPTYNQAKDIMWADLISLAGSVPGIVVRESELSITVPAVGGGSSRIRLYGVDSPKQRLRGSYLDGVVIDEFQDIPVHVWPQQVRPMLADKTRSKPDRFGRVNQWAHFIGTPKGRNQLYTFYSRAQRWQEGLSVTSREGNHVATSTSRAWAATLLPVTETDAIDPAEIEGIRAEVGPEAFETEFMCSFDAGVAGAILKLELAEARASGRIGTFPVNPYLPVNTCWDLGLNDASAIWFFQMVAGNPIFVDFRQALGANIVALSGIVRETGYRFGTHYFPHDLTQHHLGMEKSREAQFRSCGIAPTKVRKASVPDGIAAMRSFVNRASFDLERCSDGLDLLALYRRERDEATGLLRDAPVHDMSSHAADALRTGAVGVPSFSRRGMVGREHTLAILAPGASLGM